MFLIRLCTVCEPIRDLEMQFEQRPAALRTMPESRSFAAYNRTSAAEVFDAVPPVQIIDLPVMTLDPAQ